MFFLALSSGLFIYEGNAMSAITSEQMYELEEAANDKSRGLQRRLVLVACAGSVDDLSNLSIQNPEAFADMLECIETFKEISRDS